VTLVLTSLGLGGAFHLHKSVPTTAEPPLHTLPFPASGPLSLPRVGARRGRTGHDHRVHRCSRARSGCKARCKTPSTAHNPPGSSLFLGCKVHCTTNRSPPSLLQFPYQIGVQSMVRNTTHKMQPLKFIAVLGVRSVLHNKAQPPEFIVVPAPDWGVKRDAKHHQQNTAPQVHRCSCTRSGCKACCKTPSTAHNPPRSSQFLGHKVHCKMKCSPPGTL